MPQLRRVLLLTENAQLRDFVRPISQWLDLHAPEATIQALETINEHHPDLIVLDARALTPMVEALVSAIRKMPAYVGVPLILLGESQLAKKIGPDDHMSGKFNLRRLEERIAKLLNVRLVGRTAHGPHAGSLY